MTANADGRLPRHFYRRHAVTLAKGLLGQILVRRLRDGRELSGRIVEVEAYLGIPDPVSHAFEDRRTKQNASMWLDGGHAYVYMAHGRHWCFNVVADRVEVPTTCLVRALTPVDGIEEMEQRRGAKDRAELCAGPAKLTKAMGIDQSFNGVDLVSHAELFVRRGNRLMNESVRSSPRVGTGFGVGKDWSLAPLRFTLEKRRP